MKNILCICMVVFGSVANAQSWYWVKVFGGNNYDYGNKVLMQNDGSLLMTAGFNSGMFQMDTLIIYKGTGEGCIIARFNQSGTRLSLVTGNVSGNINNNLYIGPGFMGKSNGNNVYIPFGAKGTSGLIDTISIQPFGHIAEFNSAGRCLRAKSCGTGFRDIKTIGNSLFTLGGYSGNAGVVDTFVIYDPHPSALTNKGFLAKFDSNLNAIWVKQILGGNSTQTIHLQAADNHLYFLANSDSCVLFDTMQLCNPPGIPTWAVVKTDTNGNVKWYRSGRSDLPTSGMRTLNIDGSSNIYVTGYFDTTYYFAGQTLNNTYTGGRDTYLAKLNSSGTVQWLSIIKSTDFAGVLATFTDPNGYTYMTGTFSGQCIFGTDTITSTGSQDFYVARYNSSGACLGVLAYYGVSPSGICQDSSGNFILVGSTLGFAYSDSTYITNGQKDIFIGKHSAISGTSSSKTIEPDGLLNIYANPNLGMFTIEVPQALLNSNQALLEIYSSTGQKIKEEQADISQNRLQVDLGEVEKGTYSVSLTANNRRFTGRVVIQ